MYSKTYTIEVTRIIRPKVYKLKISDSENKIIASINFNDNFEGLINYIHRFLENKKEEF